ncbi:MAG: hypothetical protein H5T78_10675 [Nocardia sp.]|nr:hypothetical protein [Nocardia sp.]
MNLPIAKSLAALALSAAFAGASLGAAHAAPAPAIVAESGSGSGSGDSGSSLAPLLTFPLGALYIVLCKGEPTGPVCALIFEIGSGSADAA